MRNFIKAAAASIAALSLSACATGFDTKVSRFQAMPAPTGESFFIVPQDPADAGGLEFAQYASIVAEEMKEEGYAQASSAEDASLIVSLGYDIDEGKERLVRSAFYDPYFDTPYYSARRAFYDPFYRHRLRYHPIYARRYYSRRSAFYFGWDDPFWAGRGLRSYTEYQSELDLDIRRAGTGEAVFEGTAKARSRTDELGTLVPNLITAMFTDFPGNNGETVKITVKPEKDD